VIDVDAHPLLEPAVFRTVFPAPLGEVAAPAWLGELLEPGAPAPLSTDDDVRRAVRDLLRGAGFRPTGRSKPSAEYLLRAASERGLARINAAVDSCNAVSLHSGLPISVVDADRAREPLRIGIAEEGTSYIFNPSGQVIDVGRLLCLFDADGPCANAVKDAQRTKTDGATTRTLTVVWGTSALAGRAAAALAWYAELLERLGARVEVLIEPPERTS
jgi:DNA/RNA-binding domain of Phe-tRNA-synthetase-like protein